MRGGPTYGKPYSFATSTTHRIARSLMVLPIRLIAPIARRCGRSSSRRFLDRLSECCVLEDFLSMARQ